VKCGNDLVYKARDSRVTPNSKMAICSLAQIRAEELYIY